MAEAEVRHPAKAQSKFEPTTVPSSARLPAQDKAPETRKKGRSVFAQAFGTLQKAKQKEGVTTEAERKRKEIDARIYGKITRDVNIVRRQDEAKRDRVNASRKEEELAIKDEVMKFRQSCFPRLAGFLLTSDDIPLDGDENKDPEPEPEPESSSPDASGDIAPFGPKLKKPLTHPPPLKQPPALYFRPAILTPAQKKFLDAQEATVKEILAEEQKEWDETKKVGLLEVKSLRKQAEETLVPVKDKEEKMEQLDEAARKKNDEEVTARIAAGKQAAATADVEMEVENEVPDAENAESRGMDSEERIEY